MIKLDDENLLRIRTLLDRLDEESNVVILDDIREIKSILDTLERAQRDTFIPKPYGSWAERKWKDVDDSGSTFSLPKISEKNLRSLSDMLYKNQVKAQTDIDANTITKSGGIIN